jgi:hypothetical protein
MVNPADTAKLPYTQYQHPFDNSMVTHDTLLR